MTAKTSFPILLSLPRPWQTGQKCRRKSSVETLSKVAVTAAALAARTMVPNVRVAGLMERSDFGGRLESLVGYASCPDKAKVHSAGR